VIKGDYKTALIIFALIVGVVSVWMNWEVVRTSMDWTKHSQPFPLPFYIASPPIYFYIDLSYTLIIVVIGILTYLALRNR